MAQRVAFPEDWAGFTHPHSFQQLSVTPGPRDLMPSFGLCIHMVHRHTCTKNRERRQEILSIQ